MLAGITGFECGGADVLRVIRFVFSLLDIIFIVVPIGLIVMIMIDFAKNVAAGKEDEMKKNLNLAIKRIIMAVALFLVPTIVEFSINLLDKQGVDFMGCVKIATEEEDLSQYEILFPEEEYDAP